MEQELENVFVYKNRGSLSADGIVQKGFRLKAYCEENGYLQGGSLSISEPISRCGKDLKWIVDYCHSRGISKILVDSLLDIGKTPGEIDASVQILCANGFLIEVADRGLVFSQQNEAQEQDSGMMMGGI